MSESGFSFLPVSKVIFLDKKLFLRADLTCDGLCPNCVLMVKSIYFGRILEHVGILSKWTLNISFASVTLKTCFSIHLIIHHPQSYLLFQGFQLSDK